MNEHTKRWGFQGAPLDLSHILAAPVGACRPRPKGNDFRLLGRRRLITYQSVATAIPMTYEPTSVLAYTQLTYCAQTTHPIAPQSPGSMNGGTTQNFRQLQARRNADDRNRPT